MKKKKKKEVMDDESKNFVNDRALSFIGKF